MAWWVELHHPRPTWGAQFPAQFRQSRFPAASSPGLPSMGHGFRLKLFSFIFTFCSGDATAFSVIYGVVEDWDRGLRLQVCVPLYRVLFWDARERWFWIKTVLETSRWRKCREGSRNSRAFGRGEWGKLYRFPVGFWHVWLPKRRYVLQPLLSLWFRALPESAS